MSLKKNFPVFLLAGALIFVGITSASQAQAAWSAKETSRVRTLEAKVQQLERQLASQELITVRYLATSGTGKTVDDICPGYENLENKPSISASGRLMARVDIYGNVVTDVRGNAETPSVYQCKIQVIALRSK
jgi:hypothetical protein